MKYVLIVLLLAASINTFAQSSFGVKGGLTWGNIVGNDILKVEYRPGYTFGALANRQLIGHASLQTEINYTSKIYSYGKLRAIDENKNQLDYKIDRKSKNAYLEIPLLLKYTGKGEKLLPYFMIGGTYSKLLNAKSVIGPGTRTEKPGYTTVTSMYKGSDIGITAALGTDIVRKKSKIILELRYTRGVIAMYKQSDNTRSRQPNIYNSSFSLTTGIRI
ncbi:MAG TPA: porin family protein [Cytophagaceae bacterium]|jgi:hypothetical protein